mmetsp:Transcript_12297/g.25199  ORF Transcript_12297/g.25199 Transcript_12297/m.25199 type:complete len:462 (+) Transcript_12297:160-1545(+)
MRLSITICVGVMLSTAAATTDSASTALASKIASLVDDKKYNVVAFVEPKQNIFSSRIAAIDASSLLRKQRSYDYDPSKVTLLNLSKSNNSSETLRQRILYGATMKVKSRSNNERSSSSSTSSSKTTESKTTTRSSSTFARDMTFSMSSKYLQLVGAELEKEENSITFTYYIREGKRSEIDEITDLLMDAFHADSQPAFDSYIRRYKLNHLKMMFDAMDEKDRGLFVACAVPNLQFPAANDLSSPSSQTSIATTSSPTSQPTQSEESSRTAHTPASTIPTNLVNATKPSQNEQIIGFCSVDGRTPDPSSKIEFLTPSTLASSAPRPYLSDLGVSPLHRRRGIGESLVNECEKWAMNRGYNTLYLKVDARNEGAMKLYLGSLGYRRVKLPWSEIGRSGNQFDMSVLLEKKIFGSMEKKEMKDRVKRRRLPFNLLKRLWNGQNDLVDEFDVIAENQNEMNGPPL